MSNTNNFMSEEQVENLISQGKLSPVEAPPIVPGQSAGTPPGGGPPMQSSIDPYGGVPLPPNFGLQPDLTKTVTPSSTGPIRLMPLFGGPQENAKTISIVKEAIAAIPPTVVPPPAVAAPTVLFKEDFVPLSLQTSSPSDSVQLTEDGWVFYATSFNAFNFIRGGAISHLGQLMWTNTASINNVGTVAPAISGADMGGGSAQFMSSFMPLLDVAPWTLTYIFKFDSWPFFASGVDFTANNACFYLGLTGDVNFSSQTRPRVGAWLRLDTDTTAPSIGDTTFVLEIVNNAQTANSFTRNNTQGTTLNTGVTPVPGVWHTLTISSTTAGTISLSLDGGTALTAAFPQTSLALGANGNSFTASGSKKNWELSWIVGATAPVGSLANGSSFAISGVTTPGYTTLNGTWTCSMASNAAHIWWYGSSDLASSSLNNNITVNFNPALMPFMTAGNSGVASPTAGAAGFFIDLAQLTTP